MYEPYNEVADSAFQVAGLKFQSGDLFVQSADLVKRSATPLPLLAPKEYQYGGKTSPPYYILCRIPTAENR